MKTLLTIFLLSLPCFALAGENIWAISRPVIKTTLEHVIQPEKPLGTPQLRIVRCTQGLAAVQEYHNPYGVIWAGDDGVFFDPFHGEIQNYPSDVYVTSFIEVVR